nr:hypothetical protein BaRGS_016523 [Batillaria attramentaria]
MRLSSGKSCAIVDPRLERNMDVRAVDPNFIKIFKLAQLTIEYLLYSQEYLAGLCTTLEEKTKKTEEGQEDIKKELEAVKKELAEVKRESHKRKKLLIAQQQLMHAGAGSYNKCPFCPKAFLNSSFLQSHISRRHGSGAGSAISSGVGSGSGDPIKMLSPDHGVGDGLANNPQFEAEFSQIKERLRATEAQLEEERRALASIRRKRELEEVKEVFMRELREVNEKYMASERALIELEQRHGVKRSYLGTMQDDVENEKEMLQQQRAEVAALREQLQKQFLEQLRQNPTLGLMREQLAELLAEKVEKCGIPRGAPGITDQVLQNKLAMQETQRKAFEQTDAPADAVAKATSTPALTQSPFSAGYRSTNEWTSTQWDSDEDLEDEDEISGVKPFSPAPSVRMIQSAPQVRGQNVGALARSIESQLQEDFDDESDWDNPEEAAQPAQRGQYR